MIRKLFDWLFVRKPAGYANESYSAGHPLTTGVSTDPFSPAYDQSITPEILPEPLSTEDVSSDSSDSGYDSNDSSDSGGGDSGGGWD